VKIGQAVWSCGPLEEILKKKKKKEENGVHEEFGTRPIKPVATDPYLF
jgi:hypothetical protein